MHDLFFFGLFANLAEIGLVPWELASQDIVVVLLRTTLIIASIVLTVIGLLRKGYVSADAAGLIKAPDAAAKTRMVRAYIEGLLTQARIQNDLAPLRDGVQGVFDLLGVKQSQPVAA